MDSLKDEKNLKNTLNSHEFQAMLDRYKEEDCLEESNVLMVSEKKRRLNIHQVEALEKSFEVENKLDLERKARLVEELGLEPRQVAIWFQNRRARWKTKQLERDYALLKANYDALRLDFDVLQREKEALNAELRELRGKFPGENAEMNCSVKDQSPLFLDNNAYGKSTILEFQLAVSNRETCNDKDTLGVEDGRSESDFNGTLKGESNVTNAQLMDWHKNQDEGFEAKLVRIEEQGFYSSTEESYNFLSVDQAPTLHWYYS